MLIEVGTTRDEKRQLLNFLDDLGIEYNIKDEESPVAKRTQEKFDSKMHRIAECISKERGDINIITTTLGCVLKIVLLILWYVAGDEGIGKA